MECQAEMMQPCFDKHPGGASYVVQIFLLIMLTACTPQFTTPVKAIDSAPDLSDEFFTTYDSSRLPLRVWKPSGEIAGVLIALHGFNDYSFFIEDSALFFNRHQLAVYAYDQRGFGETDTRGRWSGSQVLAQDLAAFAAQIARIHPGTPLYILGESMGGAVTILAMAGTEPPEVDGLILVAPAVWSRSEMPFYQRLLLSLTAHTIPWKRVSGQSLRISPSNNSEMLERLARDPLVIKETRIDVLYGLVNLMDHAYDGAEQLRSRLLLLYGEKDEIIPRAPVFSFYQRLPLRALGQQRMIVYEDGYHMLLRDLQAEMVRQDIVEWIKTLEH